MNYFRDIEQKIIEEAENSPLAECCGLIVIKEFRHYLPVFEVIPFKNLARFSMNRFEMDCNKFLLINNTRKIYAIYHSHVLDDTEIQKCEDFSACDINMSESWKIPLILYSTKKGVFNWYKPFSLEFPYKDRSFLLGVRDCFSLARDYYHKELNVNIPDVYRNINKSTEEIIGKTGFEQIDIKDLKENDIILLKEKSIYYDYTITIYLGGDRILGHFDTISSVKYLSYSKDKIYKVLRYEKFS